MAAAAAAVVVVVAAGWVTVLTGRWSSWVAPQPVPLPHRPAGDRLSRCRPPLSWPFRCHSVKRLMPLLVVPPQVFRGIGGSLVLVIYDEISTLMKEQEAEKQQNDRAAAAAS